MRKVQGTLSLEYSANDHRVFLDGHDSPYIFEHGLEFDGNIERGAPVTLALITVPGPNPSQSAKALFDVERIAAIHVHQVAPDRALTLMMPQYR